MINIEVILISVGGFLFVIGISSPRRRKKRKHGKNVRAGIDIIDIVFMLVGLIIFLIGVGIIFQRRLLS